MKDKLNINVIGSLFLVVALVVGLVTLGRQTRPKSLASVSGNATIAIVAPAAMTPGGTVNVTVDVGTNKLGFVQLEVDFDPTKVQLTSEISLPSGLGLNNVLVKSTAAQANATGKVILALGVQDELQAPTGTVDLGSWPMVNVSTQQNDSVQLGVNLAGTQLVNMDASGNLIPFTSQPVKIRLRSH